MTLLVSNLEPTKAGKGAPKLFVELLVEKFCINLKESCNTHILPCIPGQKNLDLVPIIVWVVLAVLGGVGHRVNKDSGDRDVFKLLK